MFYFIRFAHEPGIYFSVWWIPTWVMGQRTLTFDPCDQSKSDQFVPSTHCPLRHLCYHIELTVHVTACHVSQNAMHYFTRWRHFIRIDDNTVVWRNISLIMFHVQINRMLAKLCIKQTESGNGFEIHCMGWRVNTYQLRFWQWFSSGFWVEW